MDKFDKTMVCLFVVFPVLCFISFDWAIRYMLLWTVIFAGIRTIKDEREVR